MPAARRSPGYKRMETKSEPRAGDDLHLRGHDRGGRMTDGLIAGGAPKPMAGEDLPARNTSREAYDPIDEAPFLRVSDKPLSTFSIDVDTASYANMRRFLEQGRRPPAGAVRVEEMINYFSYDYGEPRGDDPFAVDSLAVDCPWNPDHLLVRIGLKGMEVDVAERPAANLVFLLDVSGSMRSPNKLPLLKTAFGMLTEQLTRHDTVAIIVYAGAAGLVLPPTPGNDKDTILGALNRLRAGGSTNGGAGIELAYRLAQENFVKGGVNRVMLATDGDFNVGTSSKAALVRLIEERAKSGVYLSVLGFGMGNYQDATLEAVSGKGNGNYAYIDNENEAHKVLVEQMARTLMTIAKDVKIQVEFNPATVEGYRLVGYENRRLRDRDFNDDTKDAGDIGAGHTVTALYEVVPKGGRIDGGNVDPLKYQRPRTPARVSETEELLTVKLRYKAPDGDRSKLISQPLTYRGQRYTKAPKDLRFAASVAMFGMLLRKSERAGQSSWPLVLELAEESKGSDPNGHRAEFVRLVKKAQRLGL